MSMNFILKLTLNFQTQKIRSNSSITMKPHVLKNMVLPETDLSFSDNSRLRLTIMRVKLIRKHLLPGLNHSKSQLFSHSPRMRSRLFSDNNKTPSSYSEVKMMTNQTT